MLPLYFTVVVICWIYVTELCIILLHPIFWVFKPTMIICKLLAAGVSMIIMEQVMQKVLNCAFFLYCSTKLLA